VFPARYGLDCSHPTKCGGRTINNKGDNAPISEGNICGCRMVILETQELLVHVKSSRDYWIDDLLTLTLTFLFPRQNDA
jgi:hypothetical protein